MELKLEKKKHAIIPVSFLLGISWLKLDQHAGQDTQDKIAEQPSRKERTLERRQKVPTKSVVHVHAALQR